VGSEQVVDLAGDVTLEAADDLWFGQAFGGAPIGVSACAEVVAQPAEYDDVQGVVGGAVTSAVEPVTVGSAAAGWDRGHAAQVRERGFGTKPVGVVAGGDEDLPGDLDPDAGQREQPRGGGGHQCSELSVGLDDLLGQVLVALGQPAQRRLGGLLGVPLASDGSARGGRAGRTSQ